MFRSIALITVLFAAANGFAQETAALSPEACRLLIATEKARFAVASNRAWEISRLPEIRAALRALQASLKGKPEESLVPAMEAASRAQKPLDRSSVRMLLLDWPTPRVAVLVETPRIGIRDRLDVELTELRSTSADRIVAEELAERASRRLGRGSGTLARSADEYVRSEPGIPASCFAEGVASAGQSDEDERLAVLSAESTRDEGSANRPTKSQSSSTAI